MGSRGYEYAPEKADCSGPKTKRPGNGVVQRAVVQILAGADRVLSVADVHAAVEARLGQRVSEDSVRSCLPKAGASRSSGETPGARPRRSSQLRPASTLALLAEEARRSAEVSRLRRG